MPNGLINPPFDSGIPLQGTSPILTLDCRGGSPTRRLLTPVVFIPTSCRRTALFLAPLISLKPCFWFSSPRRWPFPRLLLRLPVSVIPFSLLDLDAMKSALSPPSFEVVTIDFALDDAMGWPSPPTLCRDSPDPPSGAWSFPLFSLRLPPFSSEVNLQTSSFGSSRCPSLFAFPKPR